MKAAKQQRGPGYLSDMTTVCDLKQAMARRQLTGAPGTAEVKKQLARAV